MPFTYVTLYNPGSLGKNLCDKRILSITNLETENKTNKPKKKMFCTILLELLLPFKETANIRWTTISAQQTLHAWEQNKMAGGS